MYKGESAGAVVVLVYPMHTSQQCSKCGNIRHDLNRPYGIYHCKVCGLTLDRDLNAAMNICNMVLIKIGRGTPEFTPVEIGALTAMVTSINETGTPLR